MINYVFVPFNALDGVLAEWLPAIVRFVFWGLLSGVLALALYALLSNQQKLARVKKEIKSLQRSLLTEDLSAGEFKTLGVRNLFLSLALLKSVLVPAMVSAVPVLLVAFWLSIYYSYEPITPGDTVDIQVRPRSNHLHIEPQSAVAHVGEPIRLVVPAAGKSITFFDREEPAYVWRPERPLAATVQKEQWWNGILGDEAGYVRTDSEIETIRFGLERARFVRSMPVWMSTWELPYFLAVLVAALAVKIGFRIE